MKKIEEENKNFISLRNNYFTMLFLTSGGVAGILLSNLSTIWSVALILFGSYMIFVSISQIQTLTSKIEDNTKRINE